MCGEVVLFCVLHCRSSVPQIEFIEYVMDMVLDRRYFYVELSRDFFVAQTSLDGLDNFFFTTCEMLRLIDP